MLHPTEAELIAETCCCLDVWANGIASSAARQQGSLSEFRTEMLSACCAVTLMTALRGSPSSSLL